MGRRSLVIAVALALAIGGVIALVTFGGGRSEDAAPPPPGPFAAAGGDGSAVPAPRPRSGVVLTCADVETAHAHDLRAEADAFSRALAAKKLTLLTLEARPIGPFPDESAPTLERDKPAWFERTDRLDRVPHAVLIGEVANAAFGEPVQPELVMDTAGDIWQVRRAPTLSPRDSVLVQACAWGCWGQPPPGAEPPPRYQRGRWLLPAGHHYRGVLDVPYTTPGTIVNIIDQHCPMPA